MPYYSGPKLPPRFGEGHRLYSAVGQYHWLDSLSIYISSCVLYYILCSVIVWAHCTVSLIG